MKTRLAQILSLRPGEGRLVFLMGFLLVGNSAALAVSNVVSVSGFLSEVGVDKLLIVWIIDLLLVGLATGLQSLIVDRFQRTNLLRWMSFVFALFYVILRMMFVFGVPGWVNYSVLLVLTDQQWLFFPVIFWLLANDTFELSQAKRLFPVIASGSYIGQTLGLGIAAAAPGLLKRLDVSSTELLSMNVLIYLLIYLVISEGLREVHVVQRPRQQESVREALTEGWGFVREVPSFRYLMLAMLITSVALTIVQFHFFDITSKDTSFNGADSFQTFYSLYSLGITLLGVAIQTLLTSRLINKLGLKNVFMIFPVILLAGLSWLLVFPTNLIGVISGLALPKLAQNTVDEPARKSFQALVPQERRGRVSMFMDTYLFAAGGIAGSVLIGIVILAKGWLGSLEPYYIYLSVAAAASVVTIWFTFRMRSVYEASLLNWRLKRRQRASGVLDKLEF